jgi:hypothetical protein
MNRFSEKQISAQESLTVSRLANIAVGYNPKFERPEQSLIELMHWARILVSQNDSGDWIPFIHNKISIDGSFMQFCEESGISINAIHTDALTSWESDHHDEHFVGVGIFHIAKGDLKFYHCGLFHKGNQNEDEVSFFVLVKKNDYEPYVALRNEYEAWQNKRERDSQEIEVIGGESIPYDPSVSWDDIFLHGDLKERIITTIDGFLNSKAIYEKLKVPWRRGIGFWGNRGCHAKGTKILMFDGSLKNVEDVIIGDFLMGPDSKPREVLQLVRGQDEMFEVTPSKSSSFVVNGEHIIHLKTSKNVRSMPNEINISINQYRKLSDGVKRSSWYTLQKPKIVEFTQNTVELDSYFIGLWLGDGTSGGTGITVSDEDKSTIQYLHCMAKSYDLLTPQRKDGASCVTYNLATRVGGSNEIRKILKSLGILNDKRIPKKYLVSSVQDRLNLLAGLIDSDGHYHVADTKLPTKGYYEITQKRQGLANDIVYLSRSLGFRATITETTKTIKDIGFIGTYFRVGISGDVERIPVRLARKEASIGNPNKSHLSYGIKSINSIGMGYYYGFVINEDHLYLDGDFFIHHNCGKTSCLRVIMAQYPQLKPVTIQPGHQNPDELLEEAFEYAEQHSPSLLFFEDLQEMMKTIDIRHFLQLLDGLQKRDGILTIVTGNDFSSLEENIKSRPRRFDSFFEFPLPDIDQTIKYLNKYLVDILSTKKIESIAKKAVKNKLTYAHLQELYFNAVFIAIPEGREVPSAANVDLSLKQVLEEKKNADSDFSSKRRDLTDDFEEEDDGDGL